MDSSSTNQVMSSLRNGGDLLTEARVNWVVLFPILWVLALLSGCIDSRAVSAPTRIASQVASSTPLPTRVSYSPCSESNMRWDHSLFKATSRNGRLEAIELTSNQGLGGRLAFSPDGTMVAINISDIGYAFNGLYVFSMGDGKLLCIIGFTEKNYVTGFAFSPDSFKLATMHFDGSLMLLDPITGIAVDALGERKYQSAFGRITFDRAGALVEGSGYFQPVRVWNVATGELVYASDLPDMDRSVSDATLSQDGRLLAEAMTGANLRIVNVLSGKVETVMQNSTDERYVLFSNDNNFVYSLNNHSEVTVWDSHTGKEIRRLNPYSGACAGYCGWEVETRLTLSVDGSRLLMEDPQGLILWNTATWQELMNGGDSTIPKWIPIVDASVYPDGNMVGVNYGNKWYRFLYLAP
jgi:WD40 repeat protein